MEKPPSEEANVDLGWREPRNVLSALWPGEGAVVQGRASGGPRGAASPGSQPVPALPPTSCETRASFLTTCASISPSVRWASSDLTPRVTAWMERWCRKKHLSGCTSSSFLPVHARHLLVPALGWVQGTETSGFPPSRTH